MLKASLEGTSAVFAEIRKEINVKIQQLADEVQVDARANTPYKTGRARKGWTKSIKKEGFLVDNKVPYIERLEAGASRQAPKGIIGPTLAQIKGKV